jgi:hypothetical protein
VWIAQLMLGQGWGITRRQQDRECGVAPRAGRVSPDADLARARGVRLLIREWAVWPPGSGALLGVIHLGSVVDRRRGACSARSQGTWWCLETEAEALERPAAGVRLGQIALPHPHRLLCRRRVYEAW